MAILNDIPKTYDDAVRTLARWHGDEPTDPVEIFLFPDPAEKVVQFIEVGEQFPAAENVAPIWFRPTDEFPFSSAVAMVTPEEWQLVLSSHLELPKGWDLNSMRRVWPES